MKKWKVCLVSNYTLRWKCENTEVVDWNPLFCMGAIIGMAHISTLRLYLFKDDILLSLKCLDNTQVTIFSAINSLLKQNMR